MTLNKLDKNFSVKLSEKIHLFNKKALCDHYEFSFNELILSFSCQNLYTGLEIDTRENFFRGKGLFLKTFHLNFRCKNEIEYKKRKNAVFSVTVRLKYGLQKAYSLQKDRRPA